MANNKNVQFLPNHADIQAILPIHELVILTKFHNNWIEIVDFYYRTISNLSFHQSLGHRQCNHFLIVAIFDTFIYTIIHLATIQGFLITDYIALV